MGGLLLGKVRPSEPFAWRSFIHGIRLSSLCSPGLELAVDVLSHHIYGPRRKTWGIEMTIVNSLARDASSHSHLFDIVSRSMTTPIHPENQLHPSEIYA